MSNSLYIIQNMQQLSKFDFLFPKDDYANWYFEKEKNIIDVSLSNLLTSKNKQYMVVAEPGYGKTRLLKEIISKSVSIHEAFFVDAKKIKKLSIEKSLSKCKKEELLNISEEKLQKLTTFKNTSKDFRNTNNTIVCIDALDEVAVSDLYKLLEKIDEFIQKNKKIKIFLSCRTHHLKKVSYDFENLDFKFVALNRFSGYQIKNFLENALKKKMDLDSIYKKSKISNLFDFISIPRYLYYFAELLKEGTEEEVVSLSRAKMFEHFIYRKLNKELREDTPQSQIDLLKRVLEKLALIMKIDGVSEITKDELMTIFDKMDSNFSQIVFRDDLMQKLYDRSLIKDNVDTVEFENQEFLDYLSAKELAKFEKVEQIFFDVAMEPYILELYPSWFYVMPFVFEFKPSMIELFLDFLQRNNKKVLSAEYFKALLNIEPENISKDLKSKIFTIVFDYYADHIKWLDAHYSHISRQLARYYDEDKYEKIKNSIDGRKNKEGALTILRTNAIRLIALLIEDSRLDKTKIKYWQNKVSEWLKLDVKEYNYLHRNVLKEFSKISNGDFEWIKGHRFIFENGIQVQGEYARACCEVAQNDKFSVDIYLDTDKYWLKNKYDKHLSRINEEYDCILKLTNTDIMEYALDKIWNDKMYRIRFCKNLDRFAYKNIKINEFKEHLLNISDDKFLKFLKNLIIKSIGKQNYRGQNCNKIYTVFIEVIVEKNKPFIKDLVSIWQNHYAEKWYIRHSFLNYISIDFLSKYFDEFMVHIDNIKDDKKSFNILKQIYYRLPDESDFRDNIISKYPDLIQEQEVSNLEEENRYRVCQEWVEKIKPEPEKFSTDLFHFYIDYEETLKTCDKYEEKLKQTINIVKEVLKKKNPLVTGKVEKNEGSGATIWQVHYYESCIEFVHKLNVELDQDTRDNVFRYLPFNINSDYETTLAVAKNPSPQAIQDVVDVYAGKREDDLGTCHVRQFVELYNRMKLPQFEPVLLEMLKNDGIKEYERIYIAQSLPNNILTADIIRKNRNKLDKSSDLWKEYLILLVNKHQDANSIDEAFAWTKQRAKEMPNHDRFYDPMSEITNNISISMTHTKYSTERDKEMLLLSSQLSMKGQYSGSNFLKKVVENHLKFLIENNNNSHDIVLDIENFLDTHKDEKDLHWFEYTLLDLKQVYLKKVDKPNIAKAIKKYNKLENEDYLPITSSFELREVLKIILEVDIRRWIEDEGAYKHIQELAKKGKNINAEDFIQKSIKSQIELALVKRGFRATDYNIIREEQLLDDKRLDFTVNYGFIGSVMIELKLSHNAESKPTTQVGKKYSNKLEKYMNGANCDYGLFAIFNVKDSSDKFKKQIVGLNELYEDMKNISVVGLNCNV